MRTKNVLLSFLLCMSAGLFSQDKEISQAEQVSNKFIYQSANALGQKYKMRVFSATLGAPHDVVRLLGLSFVIGHPLTKEEARYLLVNISKDFLQMINDDSNLRPFLKTHPFPNQGIEIEIFSVDNEGLDVYDPYITLAALINGKLIYRTKEKGQKFGYKSRVEESYDDALILMLKSTKAENQESHTK